MLSAKSFNVRFGFEENYLKIEFNSLYKNHSSVYCCINTNGKVSAVASFSS